MFSEFTQCNNNKPLNWTNLSTAAGNQANSNHTLGLCCLSSLQVYQHKQTIHKLQLFEVLISSTSTQQQRRITLYILH